MTRAEIIARWRKMMLDTVGDDALRLWDKQEADALFSDACNALCEETRYFRGSMQDTACLVALEAGKRHYLLHPSIISVEAVRPSWRNTLLARTDHAEIDAFAPAWLGAVGKPTAYLLDYEPGYLSLSHAPAAAGDSLRLTIVRRQLDNSLDALEIPAQWHKHIPVHMAYQAMFKQDSEVGNAARQADFYVAWNGPNNPNSAVEQMKQEILRMRRSALVVGYVV